MPVRSPRVCADRTCRFLPLSLRHIELSSFCIFFLKYIARFIKRCYVLFEARGGFLIILLCLLYADAVAGVAVSSVPHSVEEMERSADAEEVEPRNKKGSRTGIFFRRSEAVQFCRPGVLDSMPEARVHFDRARKVCPARDYHQKVASFCKRQCSAGAACMRGCGALCKDWLVVAEHSAKSTISRNDAVGVRECVYQSGDEESRTESRYYALKNTLSQRDAKVFKTAEKEATSAAEHFVKSLIKVCVLLRKAVAGQKALDGEVPSQGWRLLEGLYKRLYAHAQGFSEAQWSAKHDAWTLTQIMRVCDRMSLIVDHSYDSVLALVDEESEETQEGGVRA